MEELKNNFNKKVQEAYKGSIDNDYRIGYTDALDDLFGDKCLPDKQPSAQAEPRFHKGQIVIYEGRLYEVEGKTGKHHYALKGTCYEVHEDYLEPYTEPISQNPAENCDNGNLNSNCDKSSNVSADETKDETKDNMEEKELNLVDLLKGCVGEWFYVTPCGEMELKEINKLELKPLHFSRDAINCLTKTDGKAYENGSCIIYPSRALYEKYPLDPVKAWDEWASERKPKRWRAEEGKVYWRIDPLWHVETARDVRALIDDCHYGFNNYFRTEEEAQQAAEVVKKALQKFHEKNGEQ